MKTNLFSVFALLLGTLFLFLGNGLHGLLLPVRGTLEGYPTTLLGLLGTSWRAHALRWTVTGSLGVAFALLPEHRPVVIALAVGFLVTDVVGAAHEGRKGREGRR